MADLDLPALRELARKATPAPWQEGFGDDRIVCAEPPCATVIGSESAPAYAPWGPVLLSEADAAFILAARNHWDALLDEVERLRQLCVWGTSEPVGPKYDALRNAEAALATERARALEEAARACESAAEECLDAIQRLHDAEERSGEDYPESIEDQVFAQNVLLDQAGRIRALAPVAPPAAPPLATDDAPDGR